MPLLARLVAQQSRDQQTWRLRPRRHEVRATDLGTEEEPDAGWDYLANAPDRPRKPSVLVGISRVWTAADVSFHRGQECQACHNQIRSGRGVRLHYCLICSASSDDPRQWPPPLSARMARRKLRGGVGAT